MAENKKFVITVGRQYGSGGAEMAKRLGERLGLHVYDKEILKMTSEESGIRESYFHLADEKAGNKLLYRIIHSLIPENGTPSLGSDLISSDNLFRFQSSVIRKLAQEESCIIIGRCADYVLNDRDDVVSVFILGDTDARIKCLEQRQGLDEAQARKKIKEVDKDRSSFYKYYSDQTWGDAQNYDLCINTGKFTPEEVTEMILQAYQKQS